MRLTTIWTLPAATLGEKMRRTADWLAQQVAAHLPPRVRYWVFIQQASKAVEGEPGEVTAVPLDRLLSRVTGGPR